MEMREHARIADEELQEAEDALVFNAQCIIKQDDGIRIAQDARDAEAIRRTEAIAREGVWMREHQEAGVAAAISQRAVEEAAEELRRAEAVREENLKKSRLTIWHLNQQLEAIGLRTQEESKIDIRIAVLREGKSEAEEHQEGWTWHRKQRRNHSEKRQEGVEEHEELMQTLNDEFQVMRSVMRPWRSTVSSCKLEMTSFKR